MSSRLSSTAAGGSGGIGTVTSVGLSSAGGLHSVSGTPVTTSGTLALALATQAANTILAGPTAGGALAPTMRALVASDVPAVNPSALTGSGTVPLAGLSGITTTQLSASAGIVAGQIASVNPSALTGSGTVPLAGLSGITTTQLDAAAAITSAQIAALDAAKITTGTLPLARLSGITTSQLSASAALVAGQIASVNPSTLTGSGTVPLAALTGITTTQLDAAAAITSAQIAALDAAKITSGTLPLGRLSGITTSQLAAGAAITSGQIASVAASTITGTNTLPDGVLSTNVPLLNAANAFTAAVTITSPAVGTKPLIIKGAASQTADLQEWQDSNATVMLKVQSNGILLSTGTIQAAQFSSGTLLGCTYADAAQTGAFITPSSTSLTLSTRAAGNVGLILKGTASQTADLLQAQNSAAAVQFGITNRGSGGSPIWALKVRATANAESAAQAHTIGAATGKAIEVMDDAGASLGWIALYA